MRDELLHLVLRELRERLVHDPVCILLAGDDFAERKLKVATPVTEIEEVGVDFIALPERE